MGVFTHLGRSLPPFTGVQLEQDSEIARQQQDHQDQQDETKSATRAVTPSTAVGPGWKRTQEHQRQDHDQNSQHVVLLRIPSRDVENLQKLNS